MVRNSGHTTNFDAIFPDGFPNEPLESEGSVNVVDGTLASAFRKVHCRGLRFFHAYAAYQAPGFDPRVCGEMCQTKINYYKSLLDVQTMLENGGVRPNTFDSDQIADLVHETMHNQFTQNATDFCPSYYQKRKANVMTESEVFCILPDGGKILNRSAYEAGCTALVETANPFSAYAAGSNTQINNASVQSAYKAGSTALAENRKMPAVASVDHSSRLTEPEVVELLSSDDEEEEKFPATGQVVIEISDSDDEMLDEERMFRASVLGAAGITEEDLEGQKQCLSVYANDH